MLRTPTYMILYLSAWTAKLCSSYWGKKNKMLFSNLMKCFQVCLPAFHERKCVSVTTTWVLALMAPYRDASELNCSDASIGGTYWLRWWEGPEGGEALWFSEPSCLEWCPCRAKPYCYAFYLPPYSRSKVPKSSWLGMLNLLADQAR